MILAQLAGMSASGKEAHVTKGSYRAACKLCMIAEFGQKEAYEGDLHVKLMSLLI
jgi:hypothetical protein